MYYFRKTNVFLPVLARSLKQKFRNYVFSNLSFDIVRVTFLFITRITLQGIYISCYGSPSLDYNLESESLSLYTNVL